MDRAALEKQLNELEVLHNQLDEKISRGYSNYLDDAGLGKMKQEKLILKREIESIKDRLNDPFFNVLR
jgi:hypothetical protein